MILLAIDTSARFCTAALYDSEKETFLARKSEDIGRGHAERLMGLLGEVLECAGSGYKDIEQIAVTRGPGSFTGIRVGLATARGLALGLGVPVTGVSVLEAIAHQHNSAARTCPLVVAMDARRGEVFMQVFSNKNDPLEEPKVAKLENIANHLPHSPFYLAGSASDLIVDAIGGGVEIWSRQATADIDDVAILGAGLSIEDNPPEPLYLRQADAKPQNNFAVTWVESSVQQKKSL